MNSHRLVVAKQMGNKNGESSAENYCSVVFISIFDSSTMERVCKSGHKNHCYRHLIHVDNGYTIRKRFLEAGANNLRLPQLLYTEKFSFGIQNALAPTLNII